MDRVFLEADYLVGGAGASGMAFADEVIMRSSDKLLTMVIVDIRSKPGGHWNDSYDFCKLHQPAAYYGVNSLALERDPNDFGSKFQILAYYENCMDELIKTGRVKWYPQCKYTGNGSFVSILDADSEYHVAIKKKEVDASYHTMKVPSTSVPPFPVDAAIKIVPINGLADRTLCMGFEEFVVIGISIMQPKTFVQHHCRWWKIWN